MISLQSDTIELPALLIKLLLQGLLVVLLSLAASDGALAVLESLPGLLVFNWILQEGVRAILVDNCILQVLFLLVGEPA